MRFSALHALAALVLVAAAVGCSRTKSTAGPAPAQVLDGVLAPAQLATRLRQAGGGHFHATARFHTDLASPPAGDDGSHPAAPATITTTTDLWMDRQGNFRLVELNDQDGGREIVRVGGEVAVALRYGKASRRPAQDTECDRYLAEGLGAPWSAWELVRQQVEVDRAGHTGFRLQLGGRLAHLPAGFAPATGLRAWRASVVVKSLDGQVSLDAAGKLPLAFTCKASYRAVRGDQPIAGEVAVKARLDEMGRVGTIAMPDAETLPTRQRTVLEERALLSGLGAAAKRTAP